MADDAEGLGILEMVNEFAGLDGSIFIQDKRGYMLDVSIQRVAERDHLDDRGEEHEEQREGIAQNHEKFLVKNSGKAAERRFHAACLFTSLFVPAVSATN